MLEKNIQTSVTLLGTIQSKFYLEETIKRHNTKGKEYTESIYLVHVAIPRLSGTVDVVPVLVSDHLAEPANIEIGTHVFIQGQFISQYEYDGDKRHLKLRVKAEDFRLSPEAPGVNQVELKGKIVKGPFHRVTPRGRNITEMLVSVYGGAKGRSYVFPCITWEKVADKAAELPNGTKIEVQGRIQSREYQKRLEDGTQDPEIRIAYEVSVDSFVVRE